MEIVGALVGFLIAITIIAIAMGFGLLILIMAGLGSLFGTLVRAFQAAAGNRRE